MSERNCWWLTGFTDGKRFLVFGSDKSEDDARQKGFEILGGVDFTIKRLPTRSLPNASRMLKGGILERTRDLKTATRRLKHKQIRPNNY